MDETNAVFCAYGGCLLIYLRDRRQLLYLWSLSFCLARGCGKAISDWISFPANWYQFASLFDAHLLVASFLLLLVPARVRPIVAGTAFSGHAASPFSGSSCRYIFERIMVE